MESFREHLLILNELSARTAINALEKNNKKLITTAHKHTDLLRKRLRLGDNFRNYANNKLDHVPNPAKGTSERMNKLERMGYLRHHRGLSTDLKY